MGTGNVGGNRICTKPDYVKLTYPDVTCPVGYGEATANKCRSVTGFSFISDLSGDANWINGCFEWYASSTSENSKKLYFNNRPVATTGNMGGNRMCTEGTEADYVKL